MILNKIIEAKRRTLERALSSVPRDEMEERARASTEHRAPHAFAGALLRDRRVHVITEVKKASPSAGVMREDFDPVRVASLYQNYGASAVSVLTEKDFFMGDLAHLREVKKVLSIPVLRKDFIIDTYQLYESVAEGADAVLLIASLLSGKELASFLECARGLLLDCLVEVHSEEDVEKALSAGSDIIGINNRDLRTFKTDLRVTERLITHIPEGKNVVSESGIHDKDDILYLKSLGVCAVLVGETLMRSRDIASTLRGLIE